MNTALAEALCDIMEHCKDASALERVLEKYNLADEERTMLRIDFEHGQYFNSLKSLAANLDSVPAELKMKLNTLIAMRDVESRALIPVTGCC